MPYALYLPISTAFEITAETQCDLALCYSKATESHDARLVTPNNIEVEIRGGANATRQINKILRPEFAADRLLIVEVYTPSGNWSSYPPHKHDVQNLPIEADLEELYYYRIDRPEGYAIQKVYTRDQRLDLTLTVRSGEMVRIPEGYHPVVAAHGYNVYYLNALAGSARSMAASDDPEFEWVRATWRHKDPRLPMVTMDMEAPPALPRG
jgi:5-deoxy-glucuronate isomerase